MDIKGASVIKRIWLIFEGKQVTERTNGKGPTMGGVRLGPKKGGAVIS